MIFKWIVKLFVKWYFDLTLILAMIEPIPRGDFVCEYVDVMIMIEKFTTIWPDVTWVNVMSEPSS